MNQIFRAALIPLAMVLTAPLTGAQETGPDAAIGSENAGAGRAEADGTAGQRGTTSKPSEPPAASPADGADADAQSSPFEYEASEKISEDLSVSFPTDI